MNIVITGASSGIGEALALHYAASGVRLGLIGRNEDRLHAVAGYVRDKGADVVTQVLDVTDQAAMDTWLNDFDNDHPIDLLIANAGVGIDTKKLTPTSLAHVRTMFDINMMGVLNTIDPIMPRMAARGTGQIALLSSIAGYRGLPSAPAYCASKGFVKLYGEGLRGRLASQGIQVNVICPGFVRSRITDQNTCPMPFFMEAEKAATIIAKGLQKNKARIAFPWPMVFGAWFLSILPAFLAEPILNRIPDKN